MKRTEAKLGPLPAPPRRGVTLVEVTAASLLLAVLAATLTQGLLALHAQRDDVRRRQTARFEATNELQRLAVLPWSELVAVPTGSVALSTAAKQWLPGGKMTVAIDTPSDDADVRRIHVELQWLGPTASQPEAPLRLTTWAYRRGRKEPP